MICIFNSNFRNHLHVELGEQDEHEREHEHAEQVHLPGEAAPLGGQSDQVDEGAAEAHHENEDLGGKKRQFPLFFKKKQFVVSTRRFRGAVGTRINEKKIA